jgi:hypothetical protein
MKTYEFLSLIFLCKSAHALYGYMNYTQLEIGNINLLLSIPHNGNLKPTSIKDRTGTDIVIDYNTRPFGEVLKNELNVLLSAKFGRPVKIFVVINNLHRQDN